MKNTTEACLAAGGVRPPKSVKRLWPHGVAPANIVTVIRQTIEAWRPYLIGDDTSVDTLKMHSFHFDFSKVIATSIYIDLGRLLHAHALKDDNMSSLARYLFLHSNLSNSQATLYAQLRKYKKR